MRWVAKTPKAQATIQMDADTGAFASRPFSWTISGDLGRRGIQRCGYAKTLASAKSMCSREIRHGTRSDVQLSWTQEA